MFKRLYIVERRFPLPEKANFRDICSFAILGLRSHLMVSAVLFFTRNFVETLEPILCKTKNGINLSLGIVLLTATGPSLILKLISDEIPPFITGRMMGSIILSMIGSFFVAWGHTAFTVLFGIAILSYSFTLRETTYIQYIAYFKPGVFKAWAIGNIISDFVHGIVLLICIMQIGVLEKVMLLYLLVPLLELLADCFIKHPVNVCVRVIERPEDDIDMNNTNMNFWTPAPRKLQFKNMRLFWQPALFYGLVVWMSMFNLQGTFELLSLGDGTGQMAYHYLYSTYCIGSLLGAGIGLLLNTNHLWIPVILEITTTIVFLMQTLNLFTPPLHKAIIFGLTFVEGSLIKFSYVSAIIYLTKNINNQHGNVITISILSLLESIFSILAAICVFMLHKLICKFNGNDGINK